MKYPVADVFCGAGGLAHGFHLEGFDVVAGIDTDPSCKYPFEKNNRSKFLQSNIEHVSGRKLKSYYPEGLPKILVGCAPCQPFSTYTNKLKMKDKKQWGLLSEFGRLLEELQPDVVSMENVPSLSNNQVFTQFEKLLKRNNYSVWWKNIHSADYGVPQSRSRLVLLASKFGPIKMVPPTFNPNNYKTVRKAISKLPKLLQGQIDSKDPLHRASQMSKTNLQRVQSSKPGGTWSDWEEELIAPCHKTVSGRTYFNVYGRMEWDKVAPTITTQFTGFGNGRFGHPTQDRALSLREGALLQTFPPDYIFVKPKNNFNIGDVTRQIGNAVPVELARAIARSIRTHLDYVGFPSEKRSRSQNRYPHANNLNRSKIMKANRGKNTGPELAVRTALWKAGVRGYRLHWKKAPGHPDIAFPKQKLAVFVNGCFWHRCPKCKPSIPKTNSRFWKEKFKANQTRDKKKIKELNELGWNVRVIWECGIETALAECVSLVKNDLKVSNKQIRRQT